MASCGGLLSSCGGALSDQLFVSPVRVLPDKPFVVRLEGLSSGQRAVLSASMRDEEGSEWSSSAIFKADEQGLVDTSEQAPVSGSYNVKDPMGLVWSMMGSSRLFIPPLRPEAVRVSAEVGDKKGDIEVERYLLGGEIEGDEVRERGLVGRFFSPAGEEPAPGVLVVGGSEGGLAQYVLREAALLAAHGYCALALAYFGTEDLPERLVEIPLEYFERAIEWLGEQKSVRDDRLGMVGHSRGGELALILGSRYPKLKAILNYVGGGVVFGTPAADTPAWTYRGEPLRRLQFPKDGSEPPQKDIEKAAIPVERIDGPVLLIAAGDDQLAPSERLSRIAYERLQRNDRPYEDELVVYPSAGHIIQAPYVPAPPAYGGDPKSNQRANEDSWHKELDLLDAALRRA